ncbi:MAG: glycosyltransferase family 4 protein [Chloroflexi bacterium]|nr:glycosyltransferase family 4 protein [Chloroflexota bacterium]
MRVCVICPGLGNAGGKAFVGGHENNAVRIAKSLAERGHETTVVTTPHLHSRPGDAHTGLEWAEVHSLRIPGTYASLRYGLGWMTKAVGEVKRLSRFGRFDVIHGHSGYPMPALITGLAGRRTATPSLHTLYCPILPVKGWRPYQVLSHSALARMYLNSVTCLGVLSRNTLQSVKGIGVPASKVRLTPPGIDLTRFSGAISAEEARRRLGLRGTGPFVLAVGDLTPRRGLSVLSAALKTVKESFPEIRLLLAVNMPLEAYAGGTFEVKTRFHQDGLDANVVPLGIVQDMPAAMAACDVMVAPYITIEGIADYPISILEAMAMGRPAVASAVGGIPEIVLSGKTGSLVPPGDARELAGALLGLLQDKSRMASMGEAGKQFVRSGFGLDARASEAEELYATLARERNPGFGHVNP